MKRPELLIAIAIWRFIAASMLVVGIIAIATLAIPAAVEDEDPGALFALSISAIVLLALITPDIPNQAKQALCLRLSHEYRCWFEINGHRNTVRAAMTKQRITLN